MKKLCSLSLALICVILAFAGCSPKSNNIKIDNKDIDNRLLYNKITNSANKAYLTDAFADDWKSQYQSVVLPETKDEVRSSLVEDRAVIECCKEKGVYIDRDSSDQYAKTEYDNLNKDNSQELYDLALKNVLSEYKISENQYQNLLYEYAYYKYNRSALKKYFQENMYEKNSNKTLDEQFDLYVETLLK